MTEHNEPFSVVETLKILLLRKEFIVSTALLGFCLSSVLVFGESAFLSFALVSVFLSTAMIAILNLKFRRDILLGRAIVDKSRLAIEQEKESSIYNKIIDELETFELTAKMIRKSVKIESQARSQRSHLLSCLEKNLVKGELTYYRYLSAADDVFDHITHNQEQLKRYYEQLADLVRDKSTDLGTQLVQPIFHEISLLHSSCDESSLALSHLIVSLEKMNTGKDEFEVSLKLERLRELANQAQRYDKKDQSF